MLCNNIKTLTEKTYNKISDHVDMTWISKIDSHLISNTAAINPCSIVSKTNVMAFRAIYPQISWVMDPPADSRGV